MLRDYSNTKSTRFRIFMSGIVQAVTRAISRSRANSPEPQAPEPQVSRHSRRGGTLNPDQVEALLGNDVRLPMTDDAKYEFAHKMRLLLSRGHKVWIQAVWGHQEETEQYTVIGQVYLKNRNDPDHSELKARWDDEQDMEYSFPFPDIDSYSLAIAKVQARMPGGERVEHLPSVDRLTISDPKNFSPIEPKTWGPWIESPDEFKPRELVRELRDTKEFGVRFNPPLVRERLFEMLVQWIYAARKLAEWTDENFYNIAKIIIEELRNHYWAAAGAPVEKVQQRLHQVKNPDDTYGRIMLEETSKQSRRVRATQPPLCFNCRMPGHLRANCPRLKDFHRGVASGGTKTPVSYTRAERRTIH